MHIKRYYTSRKTCTWVVTIKSFNAIDAYYVLIHNWKSNSWNYNREYPVFTIPQMKPLSFKQNVFCSAIYCIQSARAYFVEFNSQNSQRFTKIFANFCEFLANLTSTKYALQSAYISYVISMKNSYEHMKGVCFQKKLNVK